jgi:PIN domain
VLVVDTSVLLAAADNADPDHEAYTRAIEAASPLATTAPVIAETAHDLRLRSPSLVQKLRVLELRAGMPSRCGQRTSTHADNPPTQTAGTATAAGLWSRSAGRWLCAPCSGGVSVVKAGRKRTPVAPVEIGPLLFERPPAVGRWPAWR